MHLSKILTKNITQVDYLGKINPSCTFYFKCVIHKVRGVKCLIAKLKNYVCQNSVASTDIHTIVPDYLTQEYLKYSQ